MTYYGNQDFLFTRTGVITVKISKILSPLFLITSLIISPIAFADCNTIGDDCWQNSAILYGWIYGQKGDMTIGDNIAEVDITPKEVLENIDLIDFLFQLHWETCNGKWAFMIDPTILALTAGASLTTPLPTPRPKNITLNITSKIKFSLVDFGVFYTVYSRCFCESRRWIKLEVLGGGRNLYFVGDINIDPLVRLSNGANWFSALAGARFTASVYHGLNLSIRGDVSAGSRSHSLGATALIAYQFHPNFVVAGGFKVLHFCGENGSGENRFDMDICYYGPVLGLGVIW